MSKVLRREDIVGRRIAEVLQGPVHTEPDGYSGCAGYVRLEDGTIFGLIWTNAPESDLVAVANETQLELSRGQVFGDENGCVGDTIVNLLRSVYWPSIGVLLASDRLLVMSDDFTLSHVRLCLSKVGEVFSIDEAVPFWAPCLGGPRR